MCISLLIRPQKCAITMSKSQFLIFPKMNEKWLGDIWRHGIVERESELIGHYMRIDSFWHWNFYKVVLLDLFS